jgi:hypothetical protein
VPEHDRNVVIDVNSNSEINNILETWKARSQPDWRVFGRPIAGFVVFFLRSFRSRSQKVTAAAKIAELLESFIDVYRHWVIDIYGFLSACDGVTGTLYKKDVTYDFALLPRSFYYSMDISIENNQKIYLDFYIIMLQLYRRVRISLRKAASSSWSCEFLQQ